jgi:hypothetical protein
VAHAPRGASLHVAYEDFDFDFDLADGGRSHLLLHVVIGVSRHACSRNLHLHLHRDFSCDDGGGDRVWSPGKSYALCYHLIRIPG